MRRASNWEALAWLSSTGQCCSQPVAARVWPRANTSSDSESGDTPAGKTTPARGSLPPSSFRRRVSGPDWEMPGKAAPSVPAPSAAKPSAAEPLDRAALGLRLRPANRARSVNRQASRRLEGPCKAARAPRPRPCTAAKGPEGAGNRANRSEVQLARLFAEPVLIPISPAPGPPVPGPPSRSRALPARGPARGHPCAGSGQRPSHGRNRV